MNLVKIFEKLTKTLYNGYIVSLAFNLSLLQVIFETHQNKNLKI